MDIFRWGNKLPTTPGKLSYLLHVSKSSALLHKVHSVHCKRNVQTCLGVGENQVRRIMASPTVKLSSGYTMPVVGLGTFDDFKVCFPLYQHVFNQLVPLSWWLLISNRKAGGEIQAPAQTGRTVSLAQSHNSRWRYSYFLSVDSMTWLWVRFQRLRYFLKIAVHFCQVGRRSSVDYICPLLPPSPEYLIFWMWITDILRRRAYWFYLDRSNVDEFLTRTLQNKKQTRATRTNKQTKQSKTKQNKTHFDC